MSSDPDFFHQAFQQVQALAATFAAGSKHYLSSGYQEQEARQDFIDKFWLALGWDVHHQTQTDPYAQEVKVELGVTMSEGRKRADYAFYLGPDFKNPRFFVEAKKPSVEIANKDSYFQTLRYGWNGGTPLAVLTDFEQFHVLDCRARPDIETALSHAVQTYHYEQYADPDKFGAIYWLFSREAVAAGRLDAFVQTQMPKAGGKFLQRGLFHGGYQGIDESFLRELDEYRWTLARAFHAANPALDSETLTEATQRVLDRLVFMRFLEDKLIEPEPMVAHFADKGHSWDGFLRACRRLDTVYNGNIFKPHLIDSPKFHAPESVFGQICADLSSEQSPYLFSLIPIHILGSIYERFLGKVIVVDDSGAKVEEKPEVRKAGGVYYTPDYIVRYIVDNTVGRQIAGKFPAEIAALRFADIACGSGSFLLGVYDALLRCHTAYYNAKVKGRTAEARKAGCVEREGIWHLSLWQKRQILLDNVWGVDIDAQAVEVAQMSLYLKLLEEETTATARDQNLMHGAILPTLNKNIVFGNSLIGTDILQDTLFEPAEERKLNPLDFSHAFPQIMKNGGFDAIVGNPPYVLMQSLNLPMAFEYLREHYRSAKYKIDTYQVFLERGLNLLQAEGRLGFITPNSFLRNKYAQELRQLILEASHVELLRVFFYQVFAGASVDTAVSILVKKNGSHNDHKVGVSTSHKIGEISTEITLAQSKWLAHPDNHFFLSSSEDSDDLIAKMQVMSRPLSELATAYFGIQTFSRTAFVRTEKLNESFKPVVDGGHIKTYLLMQGSEFVNFSPEAIKSGGNHSVYEQERIGVRQIGEVPIATIIPKGLYTLNTVYNIYFTGPTDYSLKFVLGIISSSVTRWYWRQTFFDQKKTFPKVKKDALLAIPIPKLDFSDAADKARHEKMVRFVEQMLAAKKARADALMDKDIEYWQRRCGTLDSQIDALVYELYGLTDEEIALVEGGEATGAV